MTDHSPPGMLGCIKATSSPSVPSVIRACTCGTEVWVSEAMRPVVDAAEVTPKCLRCLRDVVVDHPDVVMNLHPAQLGAMDPGFRAWAEQFVASWNRRGDR